MPLDAYVRNLLRCAREVAIIRAAGFQAVMGALAAAQTSLESAMAADDPDAIASCLDRVKRLGASPGDEALAARLPPAQRLHYMRQMASLAQAIADATQLLHAEARVRWEARL